VKSFEFSSKPTFLFHYAHETLFILPIRRFILGFEVHSFFFFFRGQKDFICREFSWRKEKRKTAYWRMEGDPETGDPVGQGGEWVL
jgi:hypothetical protein